MRRWGSPGLHASEDLARALCLLLGPVLYLAPLAVAWLLPILALSILWLASDERVFSPRRDLLSVWVWAPLLFIMAVSAVWALDRHAAVILFVRMAVLVCSGTVLAATLHRLAPSLVMSLAVALAWGLSIAAAGILTELADGAVLVRLLHHPEAGGPPLADAYSRGSVFQGILLAPLAIGLWRGGNRRLAVVQGILGALAVLFGVQMAAKVALLFGAAAGGVVLAVPLSRWVLPGVMVITALAAPWVLPAPVSPGVTCWLAAHKPSALHRILIWNWVDARIRERPVGGWGLDASRRMPGGQEHIVVRGCDDPPAAPARIDNEILPLHPHDAALQIWLELGAAGMIAACFGFGAAISMAYRGIAPRDTAPLVAAISAGGAAAMLSFGIWQEWWLAVLCLGIAVGRALSQRPVATPE